ncbi:MAG: hypothetical protein ACOX1G_02365 [bacterium]
MSDLVWVGEELNPWYANEGRLPDLGGMADYFEHTSNTQRMIDSQILGSWSLLPKESMPGRLRYDLEDANEFISKLTLCGLFL